MPPTLWRMSEKQGAPIVVKADGLAAGKGVVVAMTLAEAEAAIAMMFDGAFGAAGAEVVIEEYLAGREISFFALSDGETAIALASAQDHKRVFDHDQGPNTGGMGAYSPTPFVTPEIHAEIMAKIILAHRGRHEGARHAVPRRALCRRDAHLRWAKTVRIQRPLRRSRVPGADAADDVGHRAGAAGLLRRATPKNFDLRWYPESALTVVMAAKGYPGDYAKGTRIEGLDDAAKVEGVEIFHAGTIAKDGNILANGGRVLNVCASGKTIAEAQHRAYEAVDRINWPEGFCRRDIGWQAVEREKAGS